MGHSDTIRLGFKPQAIGCDGKPTKGACPVAFALETRFTKVKMQPL